MPHTLPPIPLSSRPAKLLTLAVPVLALAAGAWWTLGPHRDRMAVQDLLSHYCVDCHNPVDLTANLVIDPASLDRVGAQPEHWEKVVRKLRAESMPPDDPRPPHEAYTTAAAFLERELDAAASERPNAGDVPLFRRLTRTEYENAIRDLLALEHLPAELDFELLLPADNASSGFDNIADLLFVSPVVMERYIGAAQKLARLAVGDMRTPVLVNIYKLSEQLPQDERVDELSFGTRGGLAVESYFPLDATYTFEIETAAAARDEYKIEVSVDGARAAAKSIGAAVIVPRRGNDHVLLEVPIAAGPHLVGITFVERSQALDEGLVRSRMRSRGTMPSIAIATIRGPYSPTGPGDTPSRKRIFVCRPTSEAEETPCAREILGTLARRAYRRATSDADLEDLMPFYEQGRADGGFDAGIQLALERLLVSPQFLYRIEREPVPHAGMTASAADARPLRAARDSSAGRSDGPSATTSAARHEAPIGVAPINDVELASRLSFFLWSSIPDDELLETALDGRLHETGVLRAQAQRMLADPRAESMVTNFAAQWLFLRDVEAKDPDIFLFPDHDVSLRRALEHETELFVGDVLRRRRQRDGSTDRALHVPERAAGPALRHAERLRQLLPPRRPWRGQPARRAARPGKHPDGDLVLDAHVAGAARQVRSRQPARLAASASAGRRAGSEDRGRRGGRPATHDARGDGETPREPGLCELPREDGPDRLRARAFRCRGALARCRRGPADRYCEQAARRLDDRWSRGRAVDAAARSFALRARVHGEAHDVRTRTQRAVLRRARDSVDHASRGREKLRVFDYRRRHRGKRSVQDAKRACVGRGTDGRRCA